MVGRRARRYSVWGKTVTLSIRYADFDTWVGRQETLPPTSTRAAISTGPWSPSSTPSPGAVGQASGVRLSNLRYESNQLPLFEEERKKVLLAGAMDQVNNRFGDFTVTYGSLLDEEPRQEKGSHVISPPGARRGYGMWR